MVLVPGVGAALALQSWIGFDPEITVLFLYVVHFV